MRELEILDKFSYVDCLSKNYNSYELYIKQYNEILEKLQELGHLEMERKLEDVPDFEKSMYGNSTRNENMKLKEIISKTRSLLFKVQILHKNEKEVIEIKINTNNVHSELNKHISIFEKDYPDNIKTAFIMMQFSNTKTHLALETTIKKTLDKYNIKGLRADDKEYADELFSNVRTYMHCADFGIAVFDRILKDDINPNVSLEVGYMLSLGKNVCYLKDSTLPVLQTDLLGKLYKIFDPQNVESTLPQELEKWLSDKGIIRD
jgi:hypothetical protein